MKTQVGLAPKILALAFAGAIACGRSAPPPPARAPVAPATTAPAPPATHSLEGARTLPATTTHTPIGVTALTSADTPRLPEDAAIDERVATILESSIDGELREARAAAQTSKRPEIRAFALEVATEEGAVGAWLTAIEGRHALAPRVSARSTAIAADYARALRRLRASRGFDDAYLAVEIAQCRRVLDLLEGGLIADANVTDLRSELRDLRRIVEARWNRARALQASLPK